MKKSKQISCRIKQDTFSKLETVSKELGVNLSDLLREILDDGLNHYLNI